MRDTPQLLQWFLALPLVLGLLAEPVAGDAWRQTAWSDTVYYRATFRADASGEARLHVVAVDRYAAYLNGAEVGTDSLWDRMLSYEVAVRRGTNNIGISVVNEGGGAGTGVMALLVGDSLRVETSTNVGIVPWYWTAQPQEGTDWTTAKVTDQDVWQMVQEGAMDKLRVQGLVDSTLSVIAGLAGGMDVGQVAGSLVLGEIDGVNLALGRPSNQSEVTDGNLVTSWDLPTNALNRFASVDLQARRRIHRVRILTRGPNEAQFEENSLRGYSVQISDDQITWSEVAQARDIARYAWSEVSFAPAFARHVRVVITALDPTTSPRVAEVQVLGLGLRDEGSYTSGVIRPGGGDGARNLGRVGWDASVPDGTSLWVQLRSGHSLADFVDPESGWCEPLDADGVWFPSPEPADLFQYRVGMASEEGSASPIFEELRIDYTAETAVSRAQGWVTPTRVPMGVDTTFTYVLSLEYGPDDQGVDRLDLEVPGQARLDESAPVAALLSSWQSSSHLLSLVFSEPLRGVDELVIPVLTATHASLHHFRAYLYGPGSDNPLNAAQNRDLDPASGEPRSWTVSASTSMSEALAQVRARPPVLTPNGDDINDFTTIEFVLSKVDVPTRVSIRLFDLSGRLVRWLDPVDLTAGEYAAVPGSSDRAPGRWDGRDQAGRRVPPGLYLYHVQIDLDRGAEARSGVVSVAY